VKKLVPFENKNKIFFISKTIQLSYSGGKFPPKNLIIILIPGLAGMSLNHDWCYISFGRTDSTCKKWQCSSRYSHPHDVTVVAFYWYLPLVHCSNVICLDFYLCFVICSTVRNTIPIVIKTHYPHTNRLCILSCSCVESIVDNKVVLNKPRPVNNSVFLTKERPLPFFTYLYVFPATIKLV